MVQVTGGLNKLIYFEEGKISGIKNMLKICMKYS